MTALCRSIVFSGWAAGSLWAAAEAQVAIDHRRFTLPNGFTFQRVAGRSW